MGKREVQGTTGSLYIEEIKKNVAAYNAETKRIEALEKYKHMKECAAEELKNATIVDELVTKVMNPDNLIANSKRGVNGCVVFYQDESICNPLRSSLNRFRKFHPGFNLNILIDPTITICGSVAKCLFLLNSFNLVE